MNVSRLVASIGGYFYSTGKDLIAVHLYGGNSASSSSTARRSRSPRRADFPWSGKIDIAVDPAEPTRVHAQAAHPGLDRGRRPSSVNGEAVDVGQAPKRAISPISRDWSAGDTVALDLPMPVRRLYAHPRVRRTSAGWRCAAARWSTASSSPTTADPGVRAEAAARRRDRGRDAATTSSAASRSSPRRAWRSRRATGRAPLPQRAAGRAAGDPDRHPLLHLGQPRPQPHAGLDQRAAIADAAEFRGEHDQCHTSRYKNVTKRFVGALPGGEEIYARAIAVHTTLDVTAEQLHTLGLEQVRRLTERARELGAELGLADAAAVREAARASATELAPDVALARAVEAIRRAEARAGQVLPPPLPEPCAVTPMPPTVADAGTPAHYTRPLPDGSRPGTYWFNTRAPGAGAGWDIEVVAFHEAVPGHHSQLARAMALTGLPVLQQFSVTAHSEGWGLYAEQLAGEFGLYSDVRARIGAVYSEMHRAARLVVDTGLHAFGWSREQAFRFMVDNVALSEAMLRAEVDRYIGWPGQALAYLVGQHELLALREQARERPRRPLRPAGVPRRAARPRVAVAAGPARGRPALARRRLSGPGPGGGGRPCRPDYHLT